jgi:hypothetical protein
MSDDFYAKRRKELGLSQSGATPSASTPSSDSFYENKRMDMGLTPDTRTQTIDDIHSSQRQAQQSVPNPNTQNLPYNDTYHKPQPLQSPAHNNLPPGTIKPDWNGLFDNPIVDTLKTINKNADAFSDAGANAIGFGLYNKLLEHFGEEDKIKNEHSVAGVSGQVIGSIKAEQL